MTPNGTAVHTAAPAHAARARLAVRLRSRPAVGVLMTLPLLAASIVILVGVWIAQRR